MHISCVESLENLVLDSLLASPITQGLDLKPTLGCGGTTTTFWLMIGFEKCLEWRWKIEFLRGFALESWVWSPMKNSEKPKIKISPRFSNDQTPWFQTPRFWNDQIPRISNDQTNTRFSKDQIPTFQGHLYLDLRVNLNYESWKACCFGKGGNLCPWMKGFLPLVCHLQSTSSEQQGRPFPLSLTFSQLDSFQIFLLCTKSWLSRLGSWAEPAQFSTALFSSGTNVWTLSNSNFSISDLISKWWCQSSQLTSDLWGSSHLWGSSNLWSINNVRGISGLWSSSNLWGSSVLWSTSDLRGNSDLWGTSNLWGVLNHWGISDL